jgi:hypothetical protein
VERCGFGCKAGSLDARFDFQTISKAEKHSYHYLEKILVNNLCLPLRNVPIFFLETKVFGTLVNQHHTLMVSSLNGISTEEASATYRLL